MRVYAVIESKPSIRDPEGETILKDLVLKGGYSSVKSIKVAKTLNFTVDADSKEEAERLVMKICDELRLYNPVVSICRVYSGDEP